MTDVHVLSSPGHEKVVYGTQLIRLGVHLTRSRPGRLNGTVMMTKGTEDEWRAQKTVIRKTVLLCPGY